MFSLSSKKPAQGLFQISRPGAHEEGKATGNSLALCSNRFFKKFSRRDFLRTEPEGGESWPKDSRKGREEKQVYFQHTNNALEVMD